jgi:tRNA threonylcarbamoyladenosine biosynthesis protein TsaE
LKYQTLYKKEASLDELESVAKDIITLLPDSAIVALSGNLASGKTTLVSQIVKLLNLGNATSPTFSLQQIYEDRVFHYDFYRIDFNEIVELGLLEEFEKEGLHFVEWADEELLTLLSQAGFELYKITITPKKSKREYILEVINA